jgi:hypothetical protein
VPGLGLSAWGVNVALVESSRSELARMYSAEQDREDGLTSVPSLPTAIARPVDAGFLTALNPAVTNQ